MTLELFKDLMIIIENTSKRISEEQAHYDFLFEDFQGLNKGLCYLLDNLVDTLDNHMGGAGWISWYVWDNNMGTNGLTAGYEGDECEIDSYEKLHDLITSKEVGA